jgi:hypothetical protein
MRYVVWLAVVYGVLLPTAETWRRGTEVVSGGVWWPGFFDDWVSGVVLLGAVWMWGRDRVIGRRCLIAAWGFVCGLGYGSFFGNLRDVGVADPSGVRHGLIVAVLGAGWGLAIAALVVSMIVRDRETARS